MIDFCKYEWELLAAKFSRKVQHYNLEANAIWDKVEFFQDFGDNEKEEQALACWDNALLEREFYEGRQEAAEAVAEALHNLRSALVAWAKLTHSAQFEVQLFYDTAEGEQHL